MTQALSQPAVKATLAQQGLEWVGSTPAEFEAFMGAEARRWNELVIAQKLTFG
jgi:tripartite-type tricarboxylate transporter receptor subunit TctC